MHINADFSRRVFVAAHEHQWVASPQQGVERVMLDRVGAEKARATSIVRYAPHSHFPGHQHPGGEEILVLSGTFSEGDRHYPAGWYLRNPPGSSHQPFSVEGAVIFVKLRQMSLDERDHVSIDTRDPASWQRQGQRDICALFENSVERVSLQRLMPDDTLLADPLDAAELLVLDGDLIAHGQAYERGSWIRLPAGHHEAFVAGTHGVTVYLKTGQSSHVAQESVS